MILALVCAGAFARIATLAPHIVIPPPEFLSDYGEDKVEIAAHVTNDGALLAGDGPRERFEMETESIEADGAKFLQPVSIRATVNPKSTRGQEKVKVDVSGLTRVYGERIHLLAKLRLPRNFGNPGAFDYEGYLRGHGIGTLASVKVDEIEVLPGTSGNRLGFWRSRMRNSILRHVREIGLWSHEDAALFAAMIVGDDSMLLRGVREEFQQTGVYHLLVVSGMNVALLAFAVFWLARRLRLPQWPASLLTIALSVFYAYIAGMGVPIVRRYSCCHCF
jgi:competence protein ComEC